MSEGHQLLERFIQLQALSLVVDKITDEVFDEAVEGDWSNTAFRPGRVERDRLEQDPLRLTAARIDLVAAHMFAELSAATEWFAEKARQHADLANEQIVQDVRTR
ncbi:MAG TPA: hypothetical protein VGQ84_04025 [Gaiellaceae bacterium]|jgi:hypothetical protein|nr:hypothetical protein [Gaiellaceae bacterium]